MYKLIRIQSSYKQCNRLCSTHISQALTHDRIKIKKIFDTTQDNHINIIGSVVKIQGWVRTVRDQKKFSFVEINDGSTLAGPYFYYSVHVPYINQ